MRKMTRLMALAIVALLALASFTGLAYAEAQYEDVEIELLVYGTTVDDWQNNHDSIVQQAIKEHTGVTLNQTEISEEQLTVLLAGGDLPDMLRIDPAKYGVNLIEGQLLVQLDELIETLGQDMAEAIPSTLEYSKLNWSNGTGNTYFVPVNIGPDIMAKENDMGAIIRWDYYKEIGAPEIKDENDLLNVLKQMQDNHPTTEDGRKVYGVALWTDWGTWYLNQCMYFFTGRGFTAESCSVNQDYSDLVSITDESEEHPYWRAIEFFFNANQMGLLDPDAFTMKYDDYEAKGTSGQLLYCCAQWPFNKFNEQNNANGVGYMSVPISGGWQWKGNDSPMGWATKCFAITNNCKDPEAAMRLMNFLWSYDGCRIMYSGVEGVNWNMVDGVPTLTDETISAAAKKDADWKMTNINLDHNIIGLSPNVVHPADGVPLSLFNSKQIYSMDLNPLQKDFSDYYEVSYPGEIFVKRLEEGIEQNRSGDNAFIGAYPNIRSDEVKRIEADLSALMLQYAAKCALAQDRDDFEKIKVEAKAEFAKAGADKNYESVSAWLDAAKADAAQYE